MKRLIPLFAAVLALALAGTAAADTFRVATPHAGNAANSGRVAPSGGDVQFTQGQNGPMSFAALRGIWQAAGNAYGIPWEVLAAINKVETNFGRNLGPSSAGAVGWMQFMPSTWARWGVDANGDGVADPNNPTDAIFSAARYLAGCGGQFDIARAVYCYNHANWYVSEVLGLAALERMTRCRAPPRAD
jgi:membrane-bound lytic murein transglycosylase B